jgi:hypothetical protein
MRSNETRADLGFAAVEGAATRTDVWDGLPAVTAIEDVLSFIAHACDRVGLNPVETFCDGLKTYRDDLALAGKVVLLANGDQQSMAAVAATHDPVGEVIELVTEREHHGEAEAV